MPKDKPVEPTEKPAKRSYKEAKLKQVLKANGHKAADVDGAKATTKDDARKAIEKLLKISDAMWGFGL